MVREEQLGGRYRADDPRALADLLLTLRANRAAASEMGRRGRALFERSFTAESVYRGFAEHVITTAAQCATYPQTIAASLGARRSHN
jgi:glycosyltransferase involved in cell wall biosynthesis